MTTPKNLEEGKPIEPVGFEIETTTEDSTKYVIKFVNLQEKLRLTTSYKKGLICKEYFSEYDLKTLLEKQTFSFENIEEYFLFLKDIIESNKLLKLENKLKLIEKVLYLEIPAKLGKVKKIEFEIKEKELTNDEKQNNILEFMNKIYLENEELKKKINEIQLENEKFKIKLEENQKKYEEVNIKQKERIKNLFKDSDIIKLNEKKLINDWIDPYMEKNITSELLFKTSRDGDSSTTFHNKCNKKGPTITFIKTTAGKRIGGFTMVSWESIGNYKKDNDAFIFSLDTYQKYCSMEKF